MDRLVSLIAAMFVFTMSDVSAQESRLQIAGTTFSEEYSGTAAVRGSVLTALVHAGSDGRVDLDDIRVDYPGSSSAATVCVRLTTADGRYWAMNPYTGAEAYAAPPGVDFPTRFSEELRRYDKGDFLALAWLGDCAERATGDEVLIPAHTARDDATRVLSLT